MWGDLSDVDTLNWLLESLFCYEAEWGAACLLCYCCGLKSEEAAKLLHVKAGTVRTYCSRGIQYMKTEAMHNK